MARSSRWRAVSPILPRSPVSDAAASLPCLSVGSFAVLLFRPEIVHFFEHDYVDFMTGLFL